MKLARFVVGLLTVFAVASFVMVSCSGGSEDDGPCKGVSCSNHGTCVVDESGQRKCECDDGYHDSFLLCIKDNDNPCLGVNCGPNGECVDDGNGNPSCDCDDGYHAEGLNCVENGPVCDGVD
jgi:hypothetical protein